MSGLKGKVGSWEFTWLSVPKGPEGSAWVQLVDGKKLEVRWRRDQDGIWLEMPDGVYGFDIQGQPDDDGGMRFTVIERGTDRFWTDLAFTRPGEESAAAAAGSKKKGVRVRAQMPGKIVRVLVEAGAEVEKDQPLLVMEAMKMENEIRAVQAGKVTAVKVAEGQAVESGADLLTLE